MADSNGLPGRIWAEPREVQVKPPHLVVAENADQAATFFQSDQLLHDTPGIESAIDEIPEHDERSSLRGLISAIKVRSAVEQP
jgi:hypothetical protein